MIFYFLIILIRPFSSSLVELYYLLSQKYKQIEFSERMPSANKGNDWLKESLYRNTNGENIQNSQLYNTKRFM